MSLKRCEIQIDEVLHLHACDLLLVSLVSNLFVGNLFTVHYVLDIDSLQRYFPCGHTHDTPHDPQSACDTPQGISPLLARSTDT